QHRPQPTGERLRRPRRHRLIRDDDELVATEPGDHALVTRAHPDALREDPDEPVARGVAEVVVDRLEPVQVEVQDGDRPRASRGGNPRLRCAGRITTGVRPCSHWASTGSALVKWTTAIGSGSATSVRGGHSATSTEARMSWSWWRRKQASRSNCSTSCASTFSL